MIIISQNPLLRQKKNIIIIKTALFAVKYGKKAVLLDNRREI